jgi:PAS domain S-box-containing protein
MAPAVLTASLPPVKFLLVDDRDENLYAFAQILRRDGLELVTARSARAALEELLIHDFALAIIDVQMPEIDGVELAEMMRGTERTEHVPIVLITAGMHERSRLFRGYEAGAVDFLYKPIEPVVLRNKAETFFQLFRQKQLLARQVDLLREAEEFQSRILDATQDDMLVLDLEGRITWANASARRFIQGDRTLTGTLFVDAWRDGDTPAVIARLESARSDHVERFVGQLRPQLGEAWIDVVLAPIHDGSGNVARLLAIGRDITEQRRTAAEREELTNKLQETLRLNEMFMAAVGHDLRNPLAAVISGARLIARRSEDAETHRIAEAVRNSGARMERMTSALFDLTRARLDGGIPIDCKQLDLRPLAERVFDEQRLAFPSRTMTLRIEGTFEGDWDGTRLEQVLSNLVGNAVQHGCVTDPIEVELIGTAPDEVRVAVRSGGAIPADLVSGLFDPFRKHGKSRSDGLGLGLFIVQQIARAHSGSVLVESEDGKCTTFRVHLPRRRCNASALEETP